MPAAIADAALAGEGFSCETTGPRRCCARTRGAVREEHTLRGGLWL